MRILITGGAGFIGSALANHLYELGNTIEVLDKLTYASDISRLNPNIKLHVLDLSEVSKLDNQYDYILHLAAETHVDNSIVDPLLFVTTNVLGTAHMLEFARNQQHLKAFLYFSTDEVFGPAPPNVNYREWDRYNSGNPYSATKAAAEELTLAYGNTYKLPVIITHTMNAFGPGQNIEKFIPSCIENIRSNKQVIIHASPDKSKPGSRFYIHVDDIASAVAFLLNNHSLQDKYNIVGSREVSNLEVAETIAKLLDKPLKYTMVDFHSSRPGHDLRYSLDGSKLAAMGWEPKISFYEGIKGII